MNDLLQNGAMISQETVKDFQDAVKDEYGVVLEVSEATQILEGMVGYFDVLATIDCKEKGQVS